MPTVKQYQKGGVADFKKKPLEPKDERNLVQKDITTMPKRDLSLMLAEYNNINKDKQELQTTGQIKTPRSIHYGQNVKTQPDIKQDSISTEQRNAPLNPLQRPLIYLASPDKLLGDLGVPGMETSELDRQAINANKFNPYQSRTDRFLNNAKLGLGYVPQAAANVGMAAAFMPEGTGALGLVNETLNPLAGIKTSAPNVADETKDIRQTLWNNLDTYNDSNRFSIDANEAYKKIPFYPKKYIAEDLEEINNYSLDSVPYKTNPEKVKKLEDIIIKHRGESFPLIRHFNEGNFNGIDEKKLLENNGVLETGTPTSFSAYQGTPHFGKNRILLDKPNTQSYFKTGMDIGAGEREIILPSKLKYEVQKKVANELGGTDYFTKIVNPYTIATPIAGASYLSTQGQENAPKFEKGGQKTDKERQAYAFYVNRGWTPEQAIGIVGNLKHESNFDTTVLGTADNKGSRAIAQWHGDRLKRLKDKYGENWTDFKNQLEFVDWELRNTEKAAGDRLKNTKNAWQAGQVVSDFYERPKIKFAGDERRQTHVADLSMKFKGIKLTPEDNINYGVTYENSVAPYMSAPQVVATPLPTVQIPQMQTQQVSYLETPTETTNLAEETEPKQSKINPQEQAFMQDLLSQMAEGVGYVEPEKSVVFQDGGKIPVSSNGMYEYPNQTVIVPTNGK